MTPWAANCYRLKLTKERLGWYWWLGDTQGNTIEYGRSRLQKDAYAMAYRAMPRPATFDLRVNEEDRGITTLV